MFIREGQFPMITEDEAAIMSGEQQSAVEFVCRAVAAGWPYSEVDRQVIESFPD